MNLDVNQDEKHDINSKISIDQKFEPDEGVYKDTLIVMAHWDGRHKHVAEEMPRYNHIKINESKSDIGNNVEYPRERDDYTVRRFTGYSDGKSSSIYKVFEIDIEDNKQEAERVKQLVDELRELPELEDFCDELDSFSEMRDKCDRVKTYQSHYSLLQAAWNKDSLGTYLSGGAPGFEIEHFREGTYKVPRLYNNHLNNLVDEKLKEEDLGAHSLAWGGFLIDSDASFDQTHELLKPFYTG